MLADHAVSAGYTPAGLNQRGFERSQHVIGTFEPGAAGEFRRVTDILLRRFRSDEAWSGGLLNRNGAPIEYSFATFSDQLRYTAELGGDDTTPEERLDAAEATLAELGGPAASEQLLDSLRTMQRRMELQWGAWLGVRHAGPTSSFKIYAEATSKACPARRDLPDTGVAADLEMIGWSPGSDRIEYYFELPSPGLRVSDLQRLLECVGLAHRADALLTLVRSFEFRAGAGSDHALPEAQWGFSHSMLPDRRDPVFALFVTARDLAGGDGLLRRQISVAAQRHGWRLGAYVAVTEPLRDRYFRSGYHNMISFVVGPDTLAGIQVSVSPPAADLGE